MNLRRKLLSSFATMAILLSMTAGIAQAQLTDSNTDQVEVNYCATSTPTVTVTAGSITVDTDTPSGHLGDLPLYDGVLLGGVVVDMDLTCNFSSNFTVTATIDTFHRVSGPDFAGLIGIFDFFSAQHFRMDNGDVTYHNYPLIPQLTAKPNVESTVFAGPITVQPGVIQDNDSMRVCFFGCFNIPAPFQSSPGVTEITWDAGVYKLPFGLAPGTYEGDLTMDLTVN